MFKWRPARGHENVFFTYENIFTVKEHFIPQNGKVITKTIEDGKKVIARVMRGHQPTIGLCSDDLGGWVQTGSRRPSVLQEVANGAKVYQETVLKKLVVKSLNTHLGKSLGLSPGLCCRPQKGSHTILATRTDCIVQLKHLKIDLSVALISQPL